MSPRPPAVRPWWIVTVREISVKLHDRSFLLSTVVTVLLARLVLSERLRLIQALGVAVALTGVVLISAG